MLCDERNSEGLRSATWVPGWGYPLWRSFERTIMPYNPTTSPLTTLMDDALGRWHARCEMEPRGLRRSLSSSGV